MVGFRLVALAASTWLCGLAGCMSGPGEEPEHHVPAHKPASFTEAVERLPRLHAEILTGASRPAESLDPRSELIDVVRWLPELAADSDLKEPAWNRVAAVSRHVNDRLAKLDAAADRSTSSYRDAAPELAAAWEELALIATLLPRPADPHSTTSGVPTTGSTEPNSAPPSN